jgi:hypothetical protein
MTAERKMDATPLCGRDLVLFASPGEGWAHLVKHPLDAREAGSWAVLIPALQATLDAGRRADLYERARAASAEQVPADLAALWAAFCELVAVAVEQGIRLEWFWEERPSHGDGRYRAFAANGILAYLDDEVVRTGFLPFKGDLPAGGDEQLRRYQLFFRCWEKVQWKYQRAAQEGRVVRAPAALEALMRRAPDLDTWRRLK